VFADTDGNCVWLGERDCSAQRRHQKLIEESPAPALAEDIRTAMGEAAVKVSRACGYVNAGTVEFLFQDGDFFFLEMNTRLQVEHPVTEFVTGIDLVAEQLHVAAGEPLSFTQESVRAARRGHAIEVRVNAENPARGRFLPSPGPIHRMRVPSGPGVRWDGGYEAGDEVSQFYDNLVGKLVVWAGDRDKAIARMLRALGEFDIDGIATTKPADIAILSHPDFAAAKHSTKWVEETLDLSGVEAAPSPGYSDGEAKVRRDVDVEVNGRRYSVAVWVPDAAPAPTAGSTVAGSGPVAARPRRSGAAAAAAIVGGSGKVAVPMQGTITKVLVSVGDTVEAGQPVCVLEAMKMENNINADKSGTVAEVKVSPGQSVGTGDIVIVID
jgi:acetyl-CoA/propionyl-CoA/long-chain acyl-CoA carboxylase, biotin carboxylase, biotin carboxyl carrier protein